MNKETLTTVASVKEAVSEMSRLELVFYRQFNRSAKIDLFYSSAGTLKDPIHSISMYWEKEDEKDAQFYRENVKTK